jgi:hypothetical protein
MNKMKTVIKTILVALLLCIPHTMMAQSLDDLDSYDVEEFYKKVELENDSLDEDGDDIDFVFVKTKVNLDEGLYEIEITDGPGDLYEIKGTDLFVRFRGYYGYAGYGEECIMKVTGSYYSPATIYKLE